MIDSDFFGRKNGGDGEEDERWWPCLGDGWAWRRNEVPFLILRLCYSNGVPKDQKLSKNFNMQVPFQVQQLATQNKDYIFTAKSHNPFSPYINVLHISHQSTTNTTKINKEYQKY